MKQPGSIAHSSCLDRSARSVFKSSACTLALVAAALAALPAHADTDITGTTQASKLSGAGNFKGGILQMDTTSSAASPLTNNFTVTVNTANTIDEFGHANTLSGVISDHDSGSAGVLNFTDSVGGGSITLTGSNTYTGITTINSGATVKLSGTATIGLSSDVIVNGALDISQMNNGASLISLGGATTGTVNLGTQNLTLTSTSDTFGGVISGTGGLIILSGAETLTGANTYTGGTTISTGSLSIGTGGTTGSITGYVTDNGTLAFNRSDAISFDGLVAGTGGLTQNGSGILTITAADTYTGVTNINTGSLVLSNSGSLLNSSVVSVTSATSVFDISATGGASVKGISGAGKVLLGNSNLTLTSASGTFSGEIDGNGGVTVAGGTWTFVGDINYAGDTKVTSAGTLKLAGATVDFNVADNGIVAFSSNGTTDMTGVLSGTGAVQQTGAGVTTIETAQTYTGVTTISAGTLLLKGSGDISQSSGLVDNGTFDISQPSSTSITSLSGSGNVVLGTGSLTLSNAQGVFSGVIAGSGKVILANGTETLSGANTFTGLTMINNGANLVLAQATTLSTSSGVIDNGVLDISTASDSAASNTATIASLGGSGSVVLGSKSLVLSHGQNTFSGFISGSGGLTITSGTEALSGANTYTGTTTISGGTLALVGGGSLASTSKVVDNGTLDISGVTGATSVNLASLAGSGGVTLGGQSLNLGSASGTFSGVIQGNGGLVLSAGTEILAGDNTYTGGTTISGGTLQIGNAHAAGSISGDVLDNGILAFNRTDTVVFSGAISGAGKVQQLGAGTTVLTANNSYNGGTLISAGTLQVGNGTATGSISGDVIDNGTLAFNRTDTYSFGNTISGAGGVTVMNGNLILTGANSYSGGTVIANGASLALNGGGSIGISAVTDNGTLDLTSVTTAPQLASLAGSGSVVLGGQTLTLSNASGDFSGVISGSGGLTVTGGTQTLSGINTYAGATQVKGGTLSVTGSIASSSSVTVANTAALAGTGTVGNVTIQSGGTLSPGVAGSGTLNVAGNLTMQGNANLLVNTISTGAPSVTVSGTAALSGTLTVSSANGTWLVGQKETVLTAAGGVNGVFTTSTLTNTNGGATFSSNVTYDTDHVYLEVDLSKLSPLLPPGSVTNNVNAIGGIDAAITAGNALPAAFENLGNVSSNTLGVDAQQLAGQIGADLPRAGNALFSPFMDTIFDHLADTKAGILRRGQKPPSSGMQFWATGFTGTGTMGGDINSGADKMKQRLSGISAGVDWYLSSRLQLGGAISAGSTSFHLAGDTGRGRADSFMAAGYGHMLFSPRVYGDFALAVGTNNVTTTRDLTVSGADTLTGKMNGLTIGGRYELGATLGWITPYLSLDDSLFEMPSYTEKATAGSSAWALHYDSNSTNQAAVELGFRQTGDFAISRNWTFRLTDRLAVQHNFSKADSVVANYASLPDSNFTTFGAPGSQDAILFSLGAEVKSRYGLGFDAHVESRIGSHEQSYVGLAGVNLGL